MLALKESPIKTLYGSTNNASTIPDYLPTSSCFCNALEFSQKDSGTNDSFPIPQRLSSALEAFANPHTFSLRKQAFNSALNSGPCYQDGHLILANSFNRPNDVTSDVWNGRIFKRLPGTYLVDIQRIWEGYDGRWMQDAPLLLRFETIDVVLAPHSNGSSLNVWTGFLDTNSPIFLQRNDSEAGKEANEQSCLQWLAYRRNANLVGKQVANVHLLSLVQTSELSQSEATNSLQPVVSRSIFSLTLEDNRTYTFINKQGNLVISTS